MMTQMITQALTTLALAGVPAGGLSDAESVSGERALLNRVGGVPVAAAGSSYGPIDPANALLGRTAGPSGFTAVPTPQSHASAIRIGAERALLGQGE